MIIKKGEIETLYKEYLLTHDNKTYELIWSNVMELLSHYIKTFLRKFVISINADELYDLVIDGSIKVMAKVKAGEEIKSFSGLIYFTASNLLRDRKSRLNKENNNIDYLDYLKNEDKNNEIYF